MRLLQVSQDLCFKGWEETEECAHLEVREACPNACASGRERAVSCSGRVSSTTFSDAAPCVGSVQFYGHQPLRRLHHFPCLGARQWKENRVRATGTQVWRFCFAVREFWIVARTNIYKHIVASGNWNSWVLCTSISHSREQPTDSERNTGVWKCGSKTMVLNMALDNLQQSL